MRGSDVARGAQTPDRRLRRDPAESPAERCVEVERADSPPARQHRVGELHSLHPPRSPRGPALPSGVSPVRWNHDRRTAASGPRWCSPPRTRDARAPSRAEPPISLRCSGRGCRARRPARGSGRPRRGRPAEARGRPARRRRTWSCPAPGSGWSTRPAPSPRAAAGGPASACEARRPCRPRNSTGPRARRSRRPIAPSSSAPAAISQRRHDRGDAAGDRAIGPVGARAHVESAGHLRGGRGGGRRQRETRGSPRETSLIDPPAGRPRAGARAAQAASTAAPRRSVCTCRRSATNSSSGRPSRARSSTDRVACSAGTPSATRSVSTAIGTTSGRPDRSDCSRGATSAAARPAAPRRRRSARRRSPHRRARRGRGRAGRAAPPPRPRSARRSRRGCCPRAPSGPAARWAGRSRRAESTTCWTLAAVAVSSRSLSRGSCAAAAAGHGQQRE